MYLTALYCCHVALKFMNDIAFNITVLDLTRKVTHAV